MEKDKQQSQEAAASVLMTLHFISSSYISQRGRGDCFVAEKDCLWQRKERFYNEQLDM